MIITMKTNASEHDINNVVDKINTLGLKAHISAGTQRTIIGVIGEGNHDHQHTLRSMASVENVIPIAKPYKIVARTSHPQTTIIDIKGIPLGGEQIQVISGPCSVETPEQMTASADAVKEAGCRLMRGGAYKPRTSPYSFQGHGVDGLKMFRDAANQYGLPIVTELMDVRELDNFMKHNVDVIQIGTRNMQNFDLLKEVGKTKVPVILKRGIAATVKEWILAAEYIAASGNHNIIFCERGVRSFETAYRNMLDITAIPYLKQETHLPVIVDPSHAGGYAWMVPALSRAAIAAGADGLLVESHPIPNEAWSDAEQALSPAELSQLMQELSAVAQAMGRTI